MKLLRLVTNEQVEIELNKNELGIICNALNEICNGIDVFEFETRIGANVDDVKELLKKVLEIYKVKIDTNE